MVQSTVQKCGKRTKVSRDDRGMYGGDFHPDVTGLYTEDYKSQQQTQIDKDESSYDKKMLRGSTTPERVPASGEVNRGPPKGLGKLSKLRGQLVTWEDPLTPGVWRISTPGHANIG